MRKNTEYTNLRIRSDVANEFRDLADKEDQKQYKMLKELMRVYAMYRIWEKGQQNHWVSQN